jgi:hypothetical protein
VKSFQQPVLLLVALFVSLAARGGAYFERYYGAGIASQGVHFAQAPDGSFLIVGSSWDSLLAVNRYFLLHVDSVGRPLFDTTFSTSIQTLARSVTALPYGRFAMVGTRIGIFYDAVTEVFLLDSAARPVNSMTYPPFDGWGTSGIGIFTARDSSICVTHFTDGFLSSNFISMMNLEDDLSVRWTAFLAYDGGAFNKHSAVQCEDGSFLSTAFFQDYWYNWPDILGATELRSITEAGGQLKDSIYSLGMESHSVNCGPGRRTMLAGRTDSTGNGDGCLVLLDSLGNQVYRRTWGSERFENPVQVVALPDSGWAVLSEIEAERFPGKHDLLLTRFNAIGDSLWSRRFGGPADDVAQQLMALTDGGFALLGSYDDSGVGRTYFVRTDTAGIVQTPYRILGDTAYACSGDTVRLSLSPVPPAGSGILWSSGDTTVNLAVTASGIYQATVTEPGNTAQLTNTYPVYLAAIPNASLGLPDTVAFCSKNLLALNGPADPSYTYTWFRNDTLLEGETTAGFTPDQAGHYTAVIGNYCSSDTARVFLDTLYALPETPVVSADRNNPICPGDSVRLSVPSGQLVFEWYRFDGSFTEFIPGAVDTAYMASQNFGYGVRVTDNQGCSVFSDPYWVVLDEDPYFVNANGPISFCAGGQVQLSAGPGSGYLWSTGDSVQNILVNATGQFSYSCISPAGCQKASDTLQVTVLDLPLIDLGPDTVLCTRDTLHLDAGDGFLFYLWSTGSSAQYLDQPFTNPGDTLFLAAYVTDTNYCSNGDTLRIVMTVCDLLPVIGDRSSALVYPNPVVATGSVLRMVLGPELQGDGEWDFYDAQGLACLRLPSTSRGAIRLPAMKPGLYQVIYREFGKKPMVCRLLVD